MSRRVPLPTSTSRRALAALAVAALSLGGFLAVAGAPSPALAAVVHHQGFSATVLGWTSWYGSYHLGDRGVAWCVDHGLRAPDADFGYVPTVLADASADVQAAIAWATAHPATDAVDAAARMLAIHDLMGATYPAGRLNVDALSVAQLSGFGGHEAAVIARARAVKADALAHAHLRGPHRLTTELTKPVHGREGRLAIRLIDANGVGIEGQRVNLNASGATLTTTQVVTGPGGRATVGFTPTADSVRMAANTTVPSSELSAWASSTVAAQRVALGQLVRLDAGNGYDVPPETTTTAPTTTTTTMPTTVPETTTTTMPATVPETTTTTLEPPVTETTTARPPPETTTTTSTTTVEDTTTTAAPPSSTTTVAPPPAAPPSTQTPPPALPRTGAQRTRGLLLAGAGLVLLGLSLSGGARRAVTRPGAPHG